MNFKKSIFLYSHSADTTLRGSDLLWAINKLWHCFSAQFFRPHRINPWKINFSCCMQHPFRVKIVIFLPQWNWVFGIWISGTRIWGSVFLAIKCEPRKPFGLFSVRVAHKFCSLRVFFHETSPQWPFTGEKCDRAWGPSSYMPAKIYGISR